MGGTPIRRNSSRKQSMQKLNTHIQKHTSSAKSNYISIAADSSAVTLHNHYTSKIKSSLKNNTFYSYINNNLKSNLTNSIFSTRTLQHAYASSLLKNNYIKPMSEGNHSENEEDNIDWSEVSQMFNMDDNVVHDLIPSGIINEINREVPDWYINFTNFEVITVMSVSPI